MKERKPDVSAEEHVRSLFPTLEDYKANPSAKLDRLIRCVTQHFGDENADAPPLCWERDGMEIPAPPMLKSPVKSKRKPKRRKIVVYCRLSQSWILVAHVSNI
jgi:hypothetical protein